MEQNAENASGNGERGHFLYMLMDLNLTFPPAAQEALGHKNFSHSAFRLQRYFRNEEMQTSNSKFRKEKKKVHTS